MEVNGVTIRPEVAAFAREMELRLRKHDEDRGDSWRQMTSIWMLGYLAQRAMRLREILAKHSVGMATSREVTEQAASVGNAAMFVMDVFGIESETPK